MSSTQLPEIIVVKNIVCVGEFSIVVTCEKSYGKYALSITSSELSDVLNQTNVKPPNYTNYSCRLSAMINSLRSQPETLDVATIPVLETWKQSGAMERLCVQLKSAGKWAKIDCKVICLLYDIYDSCEQIDDLSKLTENDSNKYIIPDVVKVYIDIYKQEVSTEFKDYNDTFSIN
jgi:hypothetical protein